jgi:hypothetical protein
VVQRIPVRFTIDRNPGDPPLRAGMSVYVDVDTGHRRVLPHVVSSALGWFHGSEATAAPADDTAVAAERDGQRK